MYIYMYIYIYIYIPYYPAYTPHFYTVQHLCQGGGACYQRVHKPEHFYIDTTGGKLLSKLLSYSQQLSTPRRKGRHIHPHLDFNYVIIRGLKGRIEIDTDKPAEGSSVGMSWCLLSSRLLTSEVNKWASISINYNL